MCSPCHSTLYQALLSILEAESKYHGLLLLSLTIYGRFANGTWTGAFIGVHKRHLASTSPHFQEPDSAAVMLLKNGVDGSKNDSAQSNAKMGKEMCNEVKGLDHYLSVGTGFLFYCLFLSCTIVIHSYILLRDKHFK